MNFTCLEELSDLDRTGLMVAMIGAAILLLLGLGLSFHLKLWQALTEIIYAKVHLKLPPPLLCLLTCFAVLGGIYGWLNNHYPADSIIFKDKPWTLGEIKQRLETVSGVDIQLKGDVASFAIDRRISGACAADVLKAICDHYRDQLICRNEPARTIIERKP
ncbi:hypothetical protein ACM1ZW_22285 [Pseudomonas sp. NFX71]|uniref:hypothetical protein n=1 Tax=Pseudomonas sp. NFX71 TaxID=3399121 RepID=UPI003A8B99CC